MPFETECTDLRVQQCSSDNIVGTTATQSLVKTIWTRFKPVFVEHDISRARKSTATESIDDPSVGSTPLSPIREWASTSHAHILQARERFARGECTNRVSRFPYSTHVQEFLFLFDGWEVESPNSSLDERSKYPAKSRSLRTLRFLLTLKWLSSRWIQSNCLESFAAFSLRSEDDRSIPDDFY